MPSTIKIRIIQACDLPIMDSGSQLTDSFVTINFAHYQQHRTFTCPKTLDPVWNQDFRLEVANDLHLQDEPLQIKVWDKDFYSADDAIGMVLIDLNPLLANENDNNALTQIHGWFPIFDTLQGCRGRLELSIKLQFFGDINVFKDSAAGLPIFAASSLEGYEIEDVYGFVEELIVNKDPEYNWRDSFRAARTSNEARQLLFNQLSSKVRRNVARKAIEMEGNAVLGYRHELDLEGETGIIARGYGTACRIRKISAHDASLNSQRDKKSKTKASKAAVPSTPAKGRTPDRSSLVPGVSLGQPAHAHVHVRRRKRQRGLVHLITMSKFPSSVQMTLGGLVSTRAVKVLAKEATLRSRDKWWAEVTCMSCMSCTFCVSRMSYMSSMSCM